MSGFAGVPTVLLIEDNDGDIGLFRIVAEQAGIKLNLRISLDGLTALEALRTWRENEASAAPALVLVDLNMPRLDGKAFLSAVRADERLCALPMVVLSSSTDRNDIDRCLKLGANAYVVKPVDFTEFSTKVRQMLGFWLKTCERPAAIGGGSGGDCCRDLPGTNS